jgi:hypothetical protein
MLYVYRSFVALLVRWLFFRSRWARLLSTTGVGETVEIVGDASMFNAATPSTNASAASSLVESDAIG